MYRRLHIIEPMFAEYDTVMEAGNGCRVFVHCVPLTDSSTTTVWKRYF